ncbi:acireductone synthase [Streptomyces rubradiris]|uniref:acireductone synthase n=1 Tax=Streptomyces rubradiris TaxID=285531 RepID=UPI0033D07DBB
MSSAADEGRRVTAVVLDIEGTVGSLTHVRDVLFPYARERLAAWVRRQRGTDRYAALLRETRRLTGDPHLDEAGVIRALTTWSDEDAKVPPLKSAQALIWAEGYADGSLHGHVYPEVPTALERWGQAGIARYVYSSGARAAQHDWFAHSNLGDLTGLLDGYFDLTDAGSKREADSYRTISRAMGAAPAEILFFSDVREELDAAVVAGWQAVGVRRAEDPRGAVIEGHPTVDRLDGIRLTPWGCDGQAVVGLEEAWPGRSLRRGQGQE